MTRNPSSSTCHLVVSTFAVFCKVRQVASRCALKSQNLRGRGKDLHSKLKTKFQSSPAPHTRPTSPSALTQRTTESRESTRYSYSIPSLLSCSWRSHTSPQSRVPRYRLLQHSGVCSNPGEAFYHQSGQPLVQHQITPVFSDLELVVCPPCLVQRLCHPWAELAEFPVSPAASARPWTSTMLQQVQSHHTIPPSTLPEKASGSHIYDCI